MFVFKLKKPLLKEIKGAKSYQTKKTDLVTINFY